VNLRVAQPRTRQNKESAAAPHVSHIISQVRHEHAGLKGELGPQTLHLDDGNKVPEVQPQPLQQQQQQQQGEQEQQEVALTDSVMQGVSFLSDEMKKGSAAAPAATSPLSL